MKNALRPLRQLRVQMTALVMALVFLTTLLLALIAGEMTRAALVEQAEENTQELLNQVIRNVEYYLDDMAALVKVVNKHYFVMRMLLNDTSIDSNLSSYYAYSADVRGLLNDLSRLRSEIMSIVIAGENGSFVGSKEAYFTTDQTPEGSLSWYGNAIKSTDKPIFLPPHLQYTYVGEPQYVISLTRHLSFDRAAPIGAISINLTLNTLAEICSQVQLGYGGYLYIVDGDGNYIYHPDGDYVERSLYGHGYADDAITTRVLEGENLFLVGDSFVINQTIPYADYYVVGVVPYSGIISDATSVQALQTKLGVVCAVLIAIITALLLSMNVFAPLNKLKGIMFKAKNGELSVKAAEIPKNEIGELGEGFNSMIGRLQLLMDSNVQKEKEKRKAELDALQAQINPHFLYNTLDSIVWMAHYKPDIAASMADSLAKLFRLMLGGGEDFVPLSQELEHVSQYLTIQKMRYSSKFEYKVEMEPGCENYYVPKLILQPLVENSIYHGIKPSRKSCHLLVRAHEDDGRLVLYVADDGVGMSLEKASTILMGEEISQKHLGGVGVKNINERITMNYGDGWGVSYYCQKGVGTVAIIELPVVTEFEPHRPLKRGGGE